MPPFLPPAIDLEVEEDSKYGAGCLQLVDLLGRVAVVGHEADVHLDRLQCSRLSVHTRHGSIGAGNLLVIEHIMYRKAKQRGADIQRTRG